MDRNLKCVAMVYDALLNSYVIWVKMVSLNIIYTYVFSLHVLLFDNVQYI